MSMNSHARKHLAASAGLWHPSARAPAAAMARADAFAQTCSCPACRHNASGAQHGAIAGFAGPRKF